MNEYEELERKAKFCMAMNEIMSTLKVSADYIMMAIKNADAKEANRSASMAATDLRHAAQRIEKTISANQ